MDYAHHTAQNRRYTALEFARLSAAEIQRLRYDFICTGCKQPAYFRKAASSGQGPCFGAHHTDDCELAVRVEVDPWGEAGDDVVQKMEADQTKIVLNLGGGKASGEDDDGTGTGRVREPGRRFSGNGGASRTQIQRNPEKLLRLLVQAPTFRTSNLLIAGPNGDVAVNKFFVEMAAARPALHQGEFHAFWGKPIYSNEWMGGRVFNGAGKPSLGFSIGKNLASAIMGRYGLTEITQLQQRYVMFLGYANVTTNSFMLTPRDAWHVAVLPAGFAE